MFGLNFAVEDVLSLTTSRSRQPLQLRNSPQVLGFQLQHWYRHLLVLQHRDRRPGIEFLRLVLAVIGSSTSVNAVFDFITGERRESHCDNDRLRHCQSVTDRADSRHQP